MKNNIYMFLNYLKSELHNNSLLCTSAKDEKGKVINLTIM